MFKKVLVTGYNKENIFNAIQMLKECLKKYYHLIYGVIRALNLSMLWNIFGLIKRSPPLNSDHLQPTTIFLGPKCGHYSQVWMYLVHGQTMGYANHLK